MIEIKKSLRAFARDRDATNTQWQVPATLPDYPNDYTRLGGLSGNFFFTEDVIDINGLTNIMEKALIVAGGQVYQSPQYAAGLTLAGSDPQSAAGELYEWLFVTDVPFDIEEWQDGISESLLKYRIPGVFTDMNVATIKTISTDNILYGRMRCIVNDVFAPGNFGKIVGESFFGDAKQTMASELYVYRCFWFVGATSALTDQLRAPELQLVITGMEGELSDLEQIMELRRSYLTQQTIA